MDLVLSSPSLRPVPPSMCPLDRSEVRLDAFTRPKDVLLSRVRHRGSTYLFGTGLGPAHAIGTSSAAYARSDPFYPRKNRGIVTSGCAGVEEHFPPVGRGRTSSAAQVTCGRRGRSQPSFLGPESPGATRMVFWRVTWPSFRGSQGARPSATQDPASLGHKVGGAKISRTEDSLAAPWSIPFDEETSDVRSTRQI